MYIPNSSLIATRQLDGSDFRPLGMLGHVAEQTWSDTMPGGPAAMSCLLQVQPSFRHTAFDPGRVAEIYRGGSKIWEGIVGEPAPESGGWRITAKGAGTYGDNYLSIYTSWNQNDSLDQAISRGLRWNKGTLS